MKLKYMHTAYRYSLLHTLAKSFAWHHFLISHQLTVYYTYIDVVRFAGLNIGGFNPKRENLYFPHAFYFTVASDICSSGLQSSASEIRVNTPPF